LGGEKSSRNLSMDFDTADILTIGNTQLQPGHYTFDANQSNNELEVLKDDKIVAKVPCHWVQLPKKAQDSEIFSDHSRLTKVEFEGRTEAVKVG
jgi:hypothetical protein